MGINSKLLFLTFIVIFFFNQINAQSLSTSFYKKTCPKLEEIVSETTAKFISRAPSLAPALLRMHFHDCFVRGCDGSVLINSTRNNSAEMDSIPNQSLRGFQVIDTVKTAVEKECPGRVSCADILALVARDAVSQIKGPFWKVPLGRRDGNVSISIEALNNLPPPFFNSTQLIASFAAKGLNTKDLVVLSGAHTIGISHCSSFTNRLYNFSGRGDQDPALDSEYAANLKARKCRSINSTTKVEMDPGSFKTFDLSYYKLVLKRRGLFQSDAALLTDSRTTSFITQLVGGSLQNFYKEFTASMEKMNLIEPKTGSAGEIRKHCALVNS
ncbi:hypothetical protein ACS0TY_031009 [Phlomoides rotata]